MSKPRLLTEINELCIEDPSFEAEIMSKRPLRGPQAEMIKRIEQFVDSHEGGVMTIKSARQTGKNETAANLQKRHLWKNHLKPYVSSWIRTAPTHQPQIVNSKKRLEEILKIDHKGVIKHPLFLNSKIQKREGYIWQYGNATVEFMSSGPHSNVVGATASECLDMDEAHKVSKDKFDEDFAPFTASTNAATLLWGVAADTLDTIHWYVESNKERKLDHLNLFYPCEVWMESLPTYRKHVEDRVAALGWDHPIIKTQYRLLPVAQEGTFINGSQATRLFNSEHSRQFSPQPGKTYEMIIDVAAGNEEFNPEKQMIGEDETATDSTVVWVYEVTDQIAQNNLYPVVHLVNMYWWTGVPLPRQEEELTELIQAWRVQKVTIDGVGVGRQLAEALEQKFGVFTVNKYLASSVTASEDCFDLLARLNYGAVKLFRDDGSKEYEQFQRQVGWTKYASSEGRMNLIKPSSDRHIDMVKALTYINRNSPNAAVHQILSNASQY